MKPYQEQDRSTIFRAEIDRQDQEYNRLWAAFDHALRRKEVAELDRLLGLDPPKQAESANWSASSPYRRAP